jgi:uncharacterized protein YndB with AHSA1/START domain
MAAGAHDLVLTRTLNAPKEKLYRCWTEPELIRQWFAPRPWTISKVEQDQRPGGACNITMRSPEGQEIPNPGVYLVIEPNRRIVFTDAFGADWRPKDGAPFMVAEVTFEDAGAGKTTYTATARHWTAEARDQHEKMGFHQGWGVCADQLEALARTI